MEKERDREREGEGRGRERGRGGREREGEGGRRRERGRERWGEREGGREKEGVREKERRRRRRKSPNTLLHKDTDLSTSRLFYKSVLITNTATLNMSNKNTNNCGKLKYILRKEEEKNILLSKTSQHTNSAK